MPILQRISYRHHIILMPHDLKFQFGSSALPLVPFPCLLRRFILRNSGQTKIYPPYLARRSFCRTCPPTCPASPRVTSHESQATTHKSFILKTMFLKALHKYIRIYLYTFIMGTSTVFRETLFSFPCPLRRFILRSSGQTKIYPPLRMAN